MPYTREDIQIGVASGETAAGVTAFFQQNIETVDECVIRSVAGNTFRAFRFRQYGILDVRPSALFRQHMIGELEGIHELFNVQNNAMFQQNLINIGRRIDSHWRRHTEAREQVSLGIGRALKLVNLTLKHALLMPQFPPNERATLMALLDVPLDSFTLGAMRCAAPQFQIPEGASMRFVTTEYQYTQIQQWIRTMAAEVDKTPLHYEIWAWNLKH